MPRKYTRKVVIHLTIPKSAYSFGIKYTVLIVAVLVSAGVLYITGHSVELAGWLGFCKAIELAGEAGADAFGG